MRCSCGSTEEIWQAITLKIKSTKTYRSVYSIRCSKIRFVSYNSIYKCTTIGRKTFYLWCGYTKNRCLCISYSAYCYSTSCICLPYNSRSPIIMFNNSTIATENNVFKIQIRTAAGSFYNQDICFNICSYTEW